MNTLFLKKIDRAIGSLLARALPRPAQPETPPGSVSRLLLIRPGGIGDAVLLLPVIRALREACPRTAIDVLAERRNGKAFSFSSHIRRVFLYDRGSDLWSVLRNRYDVVIDTEQWHHLSAVVSRLVRAPLKVGFATNGRERLFNSSVPYAHETYEADSFFNLVEPLGLTAPAVMETPFVEIGDAAGMKADALLKDLQGRSFVTLFPGASIPERRWGGEKFRSLAQSLSKEGIASVVVGGREDAIEGEKIAKVSGGLNLAGQTSLMETAAVLDRSSLLVSGDSGILHLGVGLGKPTVSFFGPGIADKWAPRGVRHAVLNKKLSCSPCTRFGYTPDCPVSARCLQEIGSDEAAGAVLRLWSEIHPKEGGLSGA